MRLRQTYRVWLTVLGAVLALLVAFFVYLLITAYHDMIVTQSLRHRLTVALHTKRTDVGLRRQLAAVKSGDQKVLAQVQAVSTDLHHVAGILHVNVVGSSLAGLFTDLESLKHNLPTVLSAATQHAIFLQHRPDMLPVNGPITSWFGWRPNPFTGTGREFHPGLDIGVPMYTPVRSVAAGVVIYAGWRAGGYGYYVKVNNGYGIETYFAHNSRVLVHVGEQVVRGQVLALSGTTGRSTGPHVYFGIDYNGVPINPWPFIHASTVSVN